VDQGGTAEGAARVLKNVAIRHGIPNAQDPLPRPSRRTRERLAEERLRGADVLDEDESRVIASSI